MPELLPLCDSGALAERGRAVVWEVQQWGRPVRAFALRIDGHVVGYLNRCVHVPTEMDWQEGEFLDGERRWIVCALHGAHYDPASGQCIAGPGCGGRLTALACVERDGRVWWQPTEHIRPVERDAAPTGEPHGQS